MLQLTKTLISTKNMTTLFVTHSKLEANFLADRILKLAGRPAQLVKD
jgi:ABC-type nitrate/sulfonate/bicarbonate transport system ATPase subunit